MWSRLSLNPRLGGVAILLLSGAFFAFTSWEWSSLRRVRLLFPILGFGLGIAGLFLVVFGNPSDRRIKSLDLSDEELDRMLLKKAKRRRPTDRNDDDEPKASLAAPRVEDTLE